MNLKNRNLILSLGLLFATAFPFVAAAHPTDVDGFSALGHSKLKINEDLNLPYRGTFGNTFANGVHQSPEAGNNGIPFCSLDTGEARDMVIESGTVLTIVENFVVKADGGTLTIVGGHKNFLALDTPRGHRLIVTCQRWEENPAPDSLIMVNSSPITIGELKKVFGSYISLKLEKPVKF